MLNFITRNFNSLWAFITAPFRAIWRMIVRIFPEREFTIMDTKNGDVLSYQQSSFWRFTKFCGTLGLVIWASWSTYIFSYHRPLLQKRTQQLEEAKASHNRQITDLVVYLQKFNNLTRSLNVIDDKILNKKLSQNEKDSLIKQRINAWGELDFLQTQITNVFTDVDYSPEFKKISELSVEYEITKAENDELRKQIKQLTASMTAIADADNQIVDLVTKLTRDKTDDLRKNLKRVNGTLGGLGLTEKELIDNANNISNQIVGSAFNPLNIDKDMDPKYQKLANDLELWNGLARLNKVMPFGAPVSKPVITSGYGMRTHPIDGDIKPHKGIDFAGTIGTELYAIAPGRVISAGERVGYGKTVEIDHGLGFSTLYAHLSKINVARGDWVRSGNIVGLGGSSGRSTGPHLHYEIRYKGTPFNPINFVKEK